jgi:hypothetical protein
MTKTKAALEHLSVLVVNAATGLERLAKIVTVLNERIGQLEARVADLEGRDT